MAFERSMFLRPKNRLEGASADIPAEELIACPKCGRKMSDAQLAQNAYVCPLCAQHMKISARARIRLMSDSFSELDADLSALNPLDFPGYDGKLAAAREASGENDSVVTGVAELEGMAYCIFAMDPDFMMGSMGSVTGEKLTRLFEFATRKSLPVVGFTVSGGARVQEGILSLMQMAKVSGAVKYHSDSGNLYICVLQDPTTGGVTASFAMQGDITIAEPGALIGFAGPRVIRQTMRQKLPEGFQRAELVKEQGFVDCIVPRLKQREIIAKLLKMHQGGGA